MDCQEDYTVKQLQSVWFLNSEFPVNVSPPGNWGRGSHTVRAVRERGSKGAGSAQKNIL